MGRNRIAVASRFFFEGGSGYYSYNSRDSYNSCYGYNGCCGLFPANGAAYAPSAVALRYARRNFAATNTCTDAPVHTEKHII